MCSLDIALILSLNKVQLYREDLQPSDAPEIDVNGDVIINALMYTGMDKTSLDTSSGSLFVRESGCLRMSTSRRT